MRLLAVCLVAALAAALAGCNVGDFFAPWPGCDPSPWTEQVIATTGAGTLVAATRDDCGFPDAVTAYRLYLNGQPFADSSMQTNHWSRAIVPSPGRVELRLYDQRCVLDERALTCTTCAGDDRSCDP